MYARWLSNRTALVGAGETMALINWETIQIRIARLQFLSLGATPLSLSAAGTTIRPGSKRTVLVGVGDLILQRSSVTIR